MTQQIILRNLQKPSQADLGEDIDWLGDSFGFYAGRDTERITAQILQRVLENVADSGSASTELLSRELELAYQRVNYHLRSLVDSGFLYRERRQVMLRHGSVKSAVEEMRKDANRIFDSLSEVAQEIDSGLGLKNR